MISHLFLAAALAVAPAASSGDTDFARGDFDLALSAYRATLATAPRDLDALLGAGTIELYQNDVASAMRDLARAAAVRPHDPLAQRRLETARERSANSRDYRVELTQDQVTIPFVNADPLPLLRVTINGKNALLVLDTGAGGIDLTQAGARRLGVATRVAGVGLFAGGKRAPIYEGRIERASVAGLTVRGIPSNIIGPSLSMGGHEVDGAIGTVFLSHFLSTIDYPHARLVLRSPNASPGFEASARRQGASIQPMWWVGDHFIFARGRIAGGAARLYNVDTGGPGVGVQLTALALRDAHIPKSEMRADSFLGGGGRVPTQTFTVPAFTLGTVNKTRVPGVYFPDGDQYGIFPFAVGGTVSQSFFTGCAVTFDFRTMNLIVETNRTSP